MNNETTNNTASLKVPTSHDYAKQLRELADWLESRPEFPIPSYMRPHESFWYDEKEPFLAAAKALGTGSKEFRDTEIIFNIEKPFGMLRVRAQRNVVCRLISPAKYECDPFLTPEEEQNLGGAA